jgi:hypothetical protein
VFLPSAIVAISIVGIGIIFVFINSFADFGISLNSFIHDKSIEDQNSVTESLIGSSIAIVMLFAFVKVSMLPALIKNKQPLYHPVHPSHPRTTSVPVMEEYAPHQI